MKHGVLPYWTYRYPLDHRSQATLCTVSTWKGDQPNDKYDGAVRRCSRISWVRVGRGIPHSEVLFKFVTQHVIP
jgi:hypothetical protein